MVGSGLYAENPLCRPAIYVRVAHATASLNAAHVRNSANVIGIAGAGDEVGDTWRIDPILAVIVKTREQPPQVDRRHLPQFVVEFSIQAVATAVVVIVALVFGVRPQENCPIRQGKRA